jgi:protein SCO1/2
LRTAIADLGSLGTKPAAIGMARGKDKIVMLAAATIAAMNLSGVKAPMELIKSVRHLANTMRTTPGLGARIAPLILAAVLTVVGACTETALASSRPSVTPENMDGVGGDFTLHSADGPVALHDFLGDVVLLYFGYTHCPDACPTTLTHWRAAFKSLSAHQRAQVRGIFVSIDPDRDSPALLKEYVNHFHPNIVGVTGTQSELQAVTEEYRASYGYEKAEDGSNDDYTVNHSGSVYIIDPTGKVRDLLTFQSSSDEIVTSIRAALRVGY